VTAPAVYTLSRGRIPIHAHFFGSVFVKVRVTLTVSVFLNVLVTMVASEAVVRIRAGVSCGLAGATDSNESLHLLDCLSQSTSTYFVRLALLTSYTLTRTSQHPPPEASVLVPKRFIAMS